MGVCVTQTKLRLFPIMKIRLGIRVREWGGCGGPLTREAVTLGCLHVDSEDGVMAPLLSQTAPVSLLEPIPEGQPCMPSPGSQSPHCLH